MSNQKNTAHNNVAILDVPCSFANDVQQYLEAIKQCVETPKQTYPLTKETVAALEEDVPGIYAIYHNGKLNYVGESGCLKERAGDLFKTWNHGFRRSVGTEYFEHHPKYETPSSTKSFDPEIEKALNDLYKESFSIVIRFGRTEVEEYLVSKFQCCLRNKRTRRGEKKSRRQDIARAGATR